MRTKRAALLSKTAALDRRTFLGAVAALAVPASAAAPNVVGVQLYTVREILPRDPLATLQALERIGYREAELTADGLDAVLAAIRKTSLKPVSLHMDSTLFMHNQDRLPSVLADAAGRGFQYVVCPYVSPSDRGGAEVAKRLAETFNRAGETSRKLGMRLCYHNHAFDFAPAGDQTLLDVLLQTADPELVGLELDIMWAAVAGVDPVGVLKTCGKRVAMLHLKNVAPGIAKRYNEDVPPSAFREVGNGTVDIPSVLAAAAQAGVQHYFVEQDRTPGDPLVSLSESYRYLQNLKP